MTTLLLIKVLHLLSATLFFGTGLGTAWYKVRADRSGDLRIIAWAQRNVVFADWVFTVPSGALMPITGLWMVTLLNIRWTAPWVLWSLGGWAAAGALWLPAAFLQIRMKRLANRALADGAELPEAFHRANRIWLALGVPAFTISVWVIYIMVTKRIPYP